MNRLSTHAKHSLTDSYSPAQIPIPASSIPQSGIKIYGHQAQPVRRISGRQERLPRQYVMKAAPTHCSLALEHMFRVAGSLTDTEGVPIIPVCTSATPLSLSFSCLRGT